MNRSILLALLLSACTERPAADTKVIVGATLLNGVETRLEHSVIVVRDGRIVAVGPQQSTPIPAGSEKVNGIGRYVISPTRGERVQVGAPADLLLMSVDGTVERRMVGGKWVDQ